jgi:hypothetical protein
MSDNLNKRGPADRSRVNVNEPWELSYWSSHFGVTQQELKAAVAKVGVMVNDVRKYLGK